MLRQLFLMTVVSSCLWAITGCGDSAPPKKEGATPAATPGAPAATPGAPAADPKKDGEAAKETSGGPDMPADVTKSDDGKDDTEVATTTPDDTADAPVSDSPAETADAAMMAMIEGIQNKKPEAVWNFMPPSYRSDLNGLARDLSGKMDPEIWTRTFEVLQHGVAALESKKELILSSVAEVENAPIDAEQQAKGYDAVISLLKTIVESELSDLEKMKEFDGHAFLAGTGSSIMVQVLSMSDMVPGNPANEFSSKLEGTKVTLITSEGDTATVKVEAPNEEPQDLEMVRVEGHWIPKEMAGEWPAMIEDSKTKLASITPEMLTEQKEQILGGLTQADQFIASFEAIQTKEELNLFAQQTMAPLVGLIAGGMAGGPPAGGEVPSDTITVMVRGELDDDTKTKIETELKAGVDDVDKTHFDALQADKLWHIELGPVADIKAFSEKIEFGKVIDVDTDAKIITVEVGEGTESKDGDSEKKSESDGAESKEEKSSEEKSSEESK